VPVTGGHVEVADLIQCEEADLLVFVAEGRRLAALGVTAVSDNQYVAAFADVIMPGVQDRSSGDRKPGFLGDLPRDANRRLLTEFELATYSRGIQEWLRRLYSQPTAAGPS